MGTLNVDGIPKLKNVLCIEGMKANLISISQLCGEDMLVFFGKEGTI